MVKDFIPCDIYRLKNLIDEYKKIKKMTDEEEDELFHKLLHNNFCRYINTKGKNKNTMCLNRFKDINDLKYCHIHRLEKKPWLQCKSLTCDGKTKTDYCRKCNKINKISKNIINIPLPIQDENEINSLSKHNMILKEIIYPNGKYFIKNYNNHIYYKTTSIKIDLILPKYDEKGLKVKKINKYHYACLYNPFMNIRMKFEIKGCINNYNKYINDLYDKYKIKNILCFVKILNRKEKNIKSLNKAYDVPLPPITDDEKLLLNLDINELYVKKIKNKKDSNGEVLELNISENKNEEKKEYNEEDNSLYNLFKNKCMKCYSYKRFILDICKIITSIYDIIIKNFEDVNKNNEIKIKEIFDILKKPKLKPLHINKIYNDLPSILFYGEKFNDLMYTEFLKICKTFYILADDIDKGIECDILTKSLSKYIFYNN